ncbi:MAG: metallophosphoesterase, partial [Clostridia bacterium]|nr:metallophosphoesterase [Clostridia bacterium]
MIRLQKDPGRDFVILNLTDPQLDVAESQPDHIAFQLLKATFEELVDRVKPDLITVSGDISWGGENLPSYKAFAELLAPTGIPWAPVWGNHDDECGPEVVEDIVSLYENYPACLYERGDLSLGSGNYVIVIAEGDQPVEALVMMNSHSGNDREILDGYCMPQKLPSYASLTPAQLDWYRAQVAGLKEMGCGDSTLILHIPPYCYREAIYHAMEDEFRVPGKVSLADSYRGIGWREAYQAGAFGVFRETVGSPDYDDGVLPVLLECDHTKNILAGHDHTNNYSIPYRGIRMTC